MHQENVKPMYCLKGVDYKAAPITMGKWDSLLYKLIVRTYTYAM